MNDKTEQTLNKLQKKIDWIVIVILVLLIVGIVYLMQADGAASRMVTQTGSSAPPAVLDDTVASNADFAACQQLSSNKPPTIAEFPQYAALVKNTIFDSKAASARAALERIEDQKFSTIRTQVQPVVDKLAKNESVSQEEKDSAIKVLKEFLRIAPANVQALEILNKIDPPAEPAPAAPADGGAGMPGAMPGMPGMMPGMPGMPGMMPGDAAAGDPAATAGAGQQPLF